MRAKGCKKLVAIRARFGRETDVTAKGEQNGPIGVPVPSLVKATVARPSVVTCAATSELWPLLMVLRGQTRCLRLPSPDGSRAVCEAPQTTHAVPTIRDVMSADAAGLRGVHDAALRC